MAKPKRSITRDSVFRSTSNDAIDPKQGRERQETQMRQTAVWLADEETEWIDTKLTEIKKGGWRGATRSAFIRALIRSAMEQNTDFAGVAGEAELTQRLTPHP